jgi:hypothetical protein
MRPDKHQRTRRASENRRGGTLLELAMMLAAVLILTVGMIDVGIRRFREHILANAARQAARSCIVHGELATVLGIWGPTPINVTGDAAGSPIAQKLVPMLVGCDLAKTTITIEWIDGGNSVGQRVRATVASPYTPCFPYSPLNWKSVTLTASSTLPIAH